MPISWCTGRPAAEATAQMSATRALDSASIVSDQLLKSSVAPLALTALCSVTIRGVQPRVDQQDFANSSCEVLGHLPKQKFAGRQSRMRSVSFADAMPQVSSSVTVHEGHAELLA